MTHAVSQPQQSPVKSLFKEHHQSREHWCHNPYQQTELSRAPKPWWEHGRAHHKRGQKLAVLMGNVHVVCTNSKFQFCEYITALVW